MKASEILAQHQLKKTPGRVSIIETIKKSEYPLSENDIKEKMGQSYDRITFYRNIQTLMSSGIVHKIVVDNTLVRYGLNVYDDKQKDESEHAHFYCEECKRVQCLLQVQIPKLQIPTGFTSSDYNLIIRGKCQHCNC